MERVFVGIDVARDRLDVHLCPPGEAFAVARDGEGPDALVSRLRALDVAQIVLEATGGFETTVAGALCANALPLAVMNPRQNRDFAPPTGRLPKIDALDAAVNARLAEAIRPDQRPVPDVEARSLGELVTRRRQIVDIMVVERARRKRLTNHRMIKRVLTARWPRSSASFPSSKPTSTTASAQLIAAPGAATVRKLLYL